ncbi:hypothetical protein [Verminephrobacter eiseniae]|uniref:hypothetical protein n=1 Tax=Verminephrobacter eiseniae TaxID=364317 RepID=UPI002237FAE9|nr:hypothetical protein [Verminephrobacter eiseniae]
MNHASTPASVAPRQRGSAMAEARLSKAATAWMAAFIASASWAQCGVTQSCIPPSPIATVCSPRICFLNAEARARYEKENNCHMLDANSKTCNRKAIDTDTQCCVRHAGLGVGKIRQKQYTKLDRSFMWDVYAKECINMKQSQAVPDKLWSQCEAGQKHSASDNYPVMLVEQNGSARSYCIDGCSTPAAAVKAAAFVGIFIFADRNNPTGAGPGGIGDASSFLAACSKHDRCYQTCNSNNQQTCDNEMLSDMKAVCFRISKDHTTTFDGNFGQETINTHEACLSAANAMHTGLRKFGSNAFNLRRQQYCQCC